LWPSQIKKLVARAERSNEPSTTARRQTGLLLQTTDTTEIPPTEILGRIFISGFWRRAGEKANAWKWLQTRETLTS